MKHTLIPATIALLMASSFAFAQETTQTEEKPAAATDADFPVDGGTTEPQVGDGYLKESFEAWELRCIKAAEGEPEECQLFNFLKDSEGNVIAQIEMQALPKGGKAAAGVVVATPLGSLLQANVLFKIDAGGTKRYPYLYCDQLGCYARFGMTAAEISAMKKGNAAKITISSVSSPDPIGLDLSLSGFTAAWGAIAPK